MKLSIPTPATTTRTPMITSCEPENDRRNVSTRLRMFVASISDLHPHDLLVCLDRLVPEGDGHLDGEVRLRRGRHVDVHVAELAGGQLLSERVGLVEALLDLLQAVAEGVAVGLVR